MINLIFDSVRNHVVQNIYIKEEVYVVFVLIAVIRDLIVVVFWFLNLTILFWKIQPSF